MPEVDLHHEGHPRHRRMVRFDWSNTPLHWVPDDPFATHMMNVLHLLLPEGERHFIKAVLEASSLGDVPELGAGIKPSTTTNQNPRTGPTPLRRGPGHSQ